jgi:hypothetical protein
MVAANGSVFGGISIACNPALLRSWRLAGSLIAESADKAITQG